MYVYVCVSVCMTGSFGTGIFKCLSCVLAPF